MKPTEYNEIDLLLRRLAKQSRSVSSHADDGQEATAHLEADELNAFAEHTLPPSTRARYTAHIVDCSQCRKLVAELSVAAGLPAVAIKTEGQSETSLWQKLSALLSPAVLRFAVPALGLLAVFTVGIIVFRQQRSPEFVARKQEPAAAKQLEPFSNSSSVNNQASGAVASSSPAAPAQNSALRTTETAKADDKAEAKAVVGEKAATVESTSGVAAKDAPKADLVAAEKPQPKFAPEPAPPPPAAPGQVAPSVGTNKNEALAKAKEKSGVIIDGAEESKDEQQTSQDRAGFLSRSRKAATAGRGGSGVQSIESRRNEVEQDKRSDSDDEIREVAGRRFRKQGSTWIDTAYNSSRGATTVLRNSEQYRALVADEPAIRTIAERLGGEVIVVWKGRAYRIR